MPNPVDVNRMRNIGRAVTDIGVLLVHTQTPGISNSAKSAYYRAVITLASGLVEALVYELIKKRNSFGDPLILTKQVHKFRHAIPATVTGGKDLNVTELVPEELHLEDTLCRFKDMNKFCLDSGYISKREFRRLDYVREKRNRIHLQKIRDADRGYTKQQFVLITEAIRFLFAKL